LAATALGTAAFVQTALAQDVTNLVALPEVDVIAPTPVPGASGLEKDKVPAFVSTVTGQEFEDKKSPAVADAITAHVPAAIAISVDGSDLSPDILLPRVRHLAHLGNRAGARGLSKRRTHQ
jgi:hypothetical protein